MGSGHCCAAVYWKSGHDGSCSAGVGSLSPNENQMLMNQAIVTGSASEALALKPPLSHTHTPPDHPPVPLFHSYLITLPLCQVLVQVSELQRQAQRPFAGGNLLV